MTARQSSLLIDESPLQVIPSLAKAIGLNEAIMLQQIHYWQRISTHEQDGRRWVAMSAPDLVDKFPFWSEKTIKRTVAELKKRGLLIITKKSTTSWERGNWYAVDYETMNTLNSASGQNDPMHRANLTLSIGPNRPDRSGQIDPMSYKGKSLLREDTRTPQKTGGAEPPFDLTATPPQKPVTPTAAAWQAYKAAIKKKYGVEPPMSPKAMGQLSQLVARVGAENAVAVVEHYVGTAKPYYQAQKHTIDTLLKDCHSLYMEMKAQHGEHGAPQTSSTVHFVKPDNTDRKMGDVPAGEAANAEALAKKWAHDYSRLIGEKGFVHVAIVTGANRKVFSIAELRGRG